MRVLPAWYLIVTMAFHWNQPKPRVTRIHHHYFDKFSRVLGCVPGAIHVQEGVEKRETFGLLLAYLRLRDMMSIGKRDSATCG